MFGLHTPSLQLVRGARGAMSISRLDLGADMGSVSSIVFMRVFFV